MPGPGCEGCTAATAATMYMALPLLVQVGTAASVVSVFARSFILGNGTSHLVWLSGITVI